MNRGEDYSRLLVAAFLLSLGILVVFQLYIVREPERIQGVLAADVSQQVVRGQQLFTDNCVQCHGKNGEGDIGPALNSLKLLKSTDDDTFFNLIGVGVPGTAMPSWSQAHGGPFTDEQIRDLVGFIRHWQATASDIPKPTPTPNPATGAGLFNSICYACHGVNGQGTNIAPALNSKELLSQFDDNWFRQTISKGRPARGMPTWGKVLSPQQIDAVVAYIRTWQTSAPAGAQRPAAGDAVKGAVLYADACSVCHGPDGAGTDRAPALNTDQMRARSADQVYDAIANGNVDKGMPAWSHVLTPIQIADLAAYLKGLK